MSKPIDPHASGGPTSRKPRAPAGDQLFFNMGHYQQSLDKNAFDNLIHSQGVRVVHMRAIPDPAGRANIGDNRAVHSPNVSSDGFIYREAGVMHAFFSNNSGNAEIHIEGMVKNDTAIITPPAYYDECDQPVLLAPYDRLFIKDVEIRIVNQQYMEASAAGIDRLQYPATCVEHLIDSDGIEYTEGQHFEITSDGHIKWTGQIRPGWDPVQQRGRVYSIRYRYIPYFVVARTLHEVRVTQVTDQVTFERKVERMPYQVLVVREHVLHDVNRDPDNPIIDNRLQYAPSVSGTLGSQ